MITRDTIGGLELYSCVPAKPKGRPPILFIHGAFAGGWMWTETFMPFLAQAGFTSHAVSLRGHGGSEGHGHLDWYGVADYVDDVATIVDHLGEEAVLIGHSMGGFVVQKYLERHSAPGAALVCSVPPQGLVAAQFHLLLQKPELFMEINRILEGKYTDIKAVHDALFAQEVSDDLLRAWLKRMQPESHRAIWDMSMFSLPNPLLMHRPPMLILGAEKDLLVPAFLVQATAQTYGLHARIFHGMGHAVTHEKDWPLVATVLRDWLESLLP